MNDNLTLNIYDNSIIDNRLTYEDKISWGCVDRLNMTGLQTYCENQLWKHKMIFNLQNNLSFIAAFGNPNHNYILDWVKVEHIDLDGYQSYWDSANNKCILPGILTMDILYANTGMMNNTQNVIVEVKFRLDNVYWWGKKINDRNVYDNFHTYVNINYYRLPLETKWWYAPGPGFIKFPRNIFYPFRIGTTTYNIQSGSNNMLVSWAMLILITLLII